MDSDESHPQHARFGTDREIALDRMTDAFFAVDADWRFRYLDEGGRQVICAAIGEELALEQLEGRHLWEAVPEAVDTVFYEKYREVMETRDPVAFEAYYAPLEERFDVRAYPAEGGGLSVYFRSVARARREKVEDREAVLREIHEVMSDDDRSFDEKVGGLLEIGRRVLDLKYGTLSHVRGEEYTFEVVRAADDSIQAGDVADLGATNCERTVLTEETLVLADVATEAPDLTDRAGFTEWGIACYVGTPVVANGDVYGTFCFYEDAPREVPFSDWEVTLVDLMGKWVSYELERQQTAAQLRRQNERLEEFASVVSHDLRNPLGVLQGSLELAEETGDPEHLDRCRHASDRMEKLIDDLLVLARSGRGIAAVEPIDLADVATEAWRTVDTRAGDLRVEVDRTVVADEGRLRQLLENLFRNAVEHRSTSFPQPTEDAGNATGDATEQDDGVIVTVGDLPDGFYVEDDGSGIPEDAREKVFESGYSTSDDGTGVGLSIVRRIARAHDWDVTATEGTDGGARFEFTGTESG